MKALFTPVALIAALFLAFGVISVACDGNSDDSRDNNSGGLLALQEYLQRLQALGNAADEIQVPIREELEDQLGAADSEEENVEAYKVFFSAILPIFEEYNDRVDNLNPPPEVEEVHNKTVEGGADVLSVIREVINALDEVESTPEIEELVETFFTDPAIERIRKACREFQGIAAENSIDVDLGC